MAFVVPASIGHAPHAAPLIDFLVANFDAVRIVAIRRKLFPHLSEDCWLLFAEGFGGSTSGIHFAPIERFGEIGVPPRVAELVPVDEWRSVWNRRLRPYLLSDSERTIYQEIIKRPDSLRLGIAASVGIGYVSGANDFFHLRPSEADRWCIPGEFLHPTVRNGRVLPPRALTTRTIDDWRRTDEPMLLLRIPKYAELPPPVLKYLDSAKGQQAREAYKCRNRNPWYSVPDVRVPGFFLTYMSGVAPNLELEPRPPLRVDDAGDQPQIVYDPSETTRSEATILGGLKTKNVDIVVTKNGIGPVLAVSCKGMTGAVRNLTNRLEETIGECTNIHIGFPTLVFGYLFLMRANREGDGMATADVMVDTDGRPVEGVVRFHHALSAISNERLESPNALDLLEGALVR